MIIVNSIYEIFRADQQNFSDFGTYGTDVFFMLLLITEGSIIVIMPSKEKQRRDETWQI